jgi:hypothetical protein
MGNSLRSRFKTSFPKRVKNAKKKSGGRRPSKAPQKLLTRCQPPEDDHAKRQNETSPDRGDTGPHRQVFSFRELDWGDHDNAYDIRPRRLPRTVCDSL